MQRCSLDIGDVHRYLSYLVLFDIPTNCLTALQCAGDKYLLTVFVEHYLTCDGVAFAFRTTFFAYIESNGIGTACRCSIEVIVYGNQEISCTASGSTCLSYSVVENFRSEVGVIALFETFFQSFVFASATNGKVFAFGFDSRRLVGKYGYSELVADTFAEFTGKLCRLFESDVRHRHQRQYVGSSHTGMFALMMTHIDYFTGFLYRLESSFQYSVGFSHKSYHRTVCSLSGVYVEQCDTTNFLYLIGYLFDNIHIATFRKIRYALNNLFLHKYIVLFFYKSIRIMHTRLLSKHQ